MAGTAAQIRIGVSGWRYAVWRGGFYPHGLAQARELAFAARQFPALELNGSFYSLQRPASYLRWAAETPPGFVFTVKAPRYITHILRLRGARAALANFLASGPLALGAKLGPILWQLPPSMAFDEALLDDFLSQLPHDTTAALQLAREREAARMQDKEWLEPVVPPMRLRHALEVRHASFCQGTTVDLLRRYRVALVVADAAADWPEVGDVTADFVYLRLHGAQQLYASGYSGAQLHPWAERIRVWAAGGTPADMRQLSDSPAPAQAARNVFCFFDNTDASHAPSDALSLAQLLGLDDQLQITR